MYASAPAPQGGQETPARLFNHLLLDMVLAGATAVVLAVASLLPWHSYGSIAGEVRMSGLELGGVVTLPMAGIAIVGSTVAILLRRPTIAASTAVPGVVATAVVVRDLRWINAQPDFIDYGSHRPLSGIYLAGFAGAALVVCGLVTLLHTAQAARASRRMKG